MHLVPNSWQFNGDVTNPTFAPSVKITGVQTVVVKGEWTGEFKTDKHGKALPYCCHYVLTNGWLNYCGDCTHELRNMVVALPDLPEL